MSNSTNLGTAPELESLDRRGDPSDQTSLIRQLTQEIFTELNGRTPSTRGPRDPGLTNGYPSGAHEATPPVHPSVPTTSPHAKALEPQSTAKEPESYEFGEPHFSNNLTQKKTSPEGSERRADSTTPGSADLSTLVSDYYFLSHPRHPSESSPTFSREAAPSTAPAFNVETIRRDFPALHQKVHGKPLIWMDNAATTHKPRSVIDATSHFYSRDNSNIHRAAHTLAARATDAFEGARKKVQKFIGATDDKQIIFLRGTTEAINLVAQSFGRKNVGAGDEIILSTIEHHANIVPWQLLAEQTGAVIRVAPVNDRGELILEQFATLLSGRTKLVSITHVANALGTVHPVEQIIALSHAYGVPVLLDAAQSAPHLPINVSALDVDFLAFSGHKVFGPTGIGILYGKPHLLESMPPWQGGGHMIRDVTFAKTIYQSAPEKFEAGTPDIAGAVGLGAAVDYLMGVGLPTIADYEHSLLEYATEGLRSIPGLRIIGTAVNKASVLSFVVAGHEPNKIGQFLDKHGIAARAGHHCAQPALRRFGFETTVRASLAFYNTRAEVDALVKALRSLPRK